ncbi:MAG TPA: MlaA family lipoprotein [Nitrospirota bacterium]|nr:MlaA family lipoprotein [Nitrospirota bacterium]
MSAIKILGTFLIFGALLAGAAWAEVKPDEGPLSQDSGQVSGRNEKTVQPEAPISGPADAATSEKVVVPVAEAPSDAEAAAKPETQPKSETATTAETAPIAEPVQGTETAPRSDVVPGTEVAPKADVTEEEGAVPEEPIEEVTIADPIEPWNRAMFTFNDKLYFWVLKPVARGYNTVVPEPVRISVRNFFRNVAFPIRFVNCLLQGKLAGAGVELTRFVFNSTIGLAGFFDVATSRFELEPRKEDFGQTLGFYGMGGLMYIVWPFLGPSTVRDTVGFAGDTFLDPVNYIDPFEAAFGVHAYERINTTSLELGDYEEMKKSSLEPYIAIRDAYIQHRKGQIKK